MKVTIDGVVGFFGMVAITAGALGGCSGGPTGAADDASGDVASVPTKIDSVSLSDATVTFYSTTRDGHTDIGMEETGSAFAKAAIVAPLVAQGLTTQEIYLALVPKGMAAPSVLAAEQANEAAAMGRSAEIRHVTVDTSALVQKSFSSCENILPNAPDGSNYWWALYDYGTQTNQGMWDVYPYNNAYSCPSSGTTTKNWVIMGACNESSTTVTLYARDFWYNGTCNTTDINPAGGTSMPPGGYDYWYWRTTNIGSVYYFQVAPNTNTSSYDWFLGYEVHR